MWAADVTRKNVTRIMRAKTGKNHSIKRWRIHFPRLIRRLQFRIPTAMTSEETSDDPLLVGLKVGSWAALSIDDRKVVGTGTTQEEAEADAKKRHHSQIELVQVPAKLGKAS
jgi:hypothetical protein